MRTVLLVRRSGRMQSDYWHYILHHSVQRHLNNREVAQFSYQVFPGLPYASHMAFRGLTQDLDFLDPPVASSCSPSKAGSSRIRGLETLPCPCPWCLLLFPALCKGCLVRSGFFTIILTRTMDRDPESSS